jgi:hypothetical protein
MRLSSSSVRVGLVVGALALLGLGRVSPAAAACGEDYREAPAQSDIPGGPPLAIGDSVLADAVPELAQDGFEADGMVCRQMSQGIAMLEARASDLPHLVVLALGTNGEVTPAQIARALEILGPGRILALVTPHGSVVPSSPEVIRAAARNDPQRILLLDWDRLASEHPGWLAPDGVHLGDQAGIDAFAQLLAGALPYAAPAQTTYAAPAQAAAPQEEPGQPTTLQVPAEHRTAQSHSAAKSHRTAKSHHAATPRRAPSKDLPATSGSRSHRRVAHTGVAGVATATTPASTTAVPASSKRGTALSGILVPVGVGIVVLLFAGISLRWRQQRV